MLGEADAEDAFGPNREAAVERVRLVVKGIASLDPYPHLVFSGCNPNFLRVECMRSAKQAALLLQRRLEFSMKHRLIVNPYRNIGLLESILHLNGNNRSATYYTGRSWNTKS